MRCIILFFLYFFALLTVLKGQGIEEKEVIYGLKGGLISGGSVWVEDTELTTDASYSLGGFIDYRVAEKLFGGLALDLHNISISDGDIDENESLFNIGVTFKALISGEDSNLIFRPGFNVGYGKLSSDFEMVDSEYFTVGGGVELIVDTDSNISWLGEVAVYAGPSGGSDQFDITFGPMFLFRGGIVF